MKLGVHVSIAGGLDKAADRAHKLGCTAFQIFSKNPRGWRARSLDHEEIDRLREKRKQWGLSPLVVHLSYLPNLAAADKELYSRSRSAFHEEIQRADQLGADYLVAHLGRNPDRKQGLERMARLLSEVLSETEPELMVLLENTAGDGNSLGGDFTSIGILMEAVDLDEHLGICMDTCHAWVYGYDLRHNEGLDELLSDIETASGLEHLRLIHANDALYDRGSRRDRHADIGKGKIGCAGFHLVTNHPHLKELPFILETPRESMEDDLRNLQRLFECARCLP